MHGEQNLPELPDRVVVKGVLGREALCRVHVVEPEHAVVGPCHEKLPGWVHIDGPDL